MGACGLAAGAFPAAWEARVERGSMLATAVPQDFLQYDPQNLPIVANGYVGTLVASNTTFISGVYNGFSSVTPSHRARIPGTVSITVDNSEPTAAALDMERAEFLILGAIDGLQVEQRTYAHREIRNLLVHEITLCPDEYGACSGQCTGPVTLELSLNSGGPSSDIDFNFVRRGVVANATNVAAPYSLFSGAILVTETPGSPIVQVAYCTTEVPPRVKIECGQTLFFLTTFYTSLEEEYSPTAAEELYSECALSASELSQYHREEWRLLWESGRLEIVGNSILAGKVNASLYELFSNVRDDWSYGMSPGGISSNAYNGHIFWDQETWMLPNMLLLQQPMAKSLLEYRISRIPQAQEKAIHHGFAGAMFPWESAFTGIECCPFDQGANPEGFLEVHINGDISFAAMQYFRASGDEQWLAMSAASLFGQVADFWVSKASWNSSAGVYDILNVQPPDESARRVNNSAYTNAVAIKSAEFALLVSELLSMDAPDSWASMATLTPIPFDEQLHYHPEYEGYDGETINQADVALMQYPLGMEFPGNVSSNDLVYYQSVTSKNGYFTGDNAYSIAWLALGNWSAAVRQYMGSFLHIHGPFNVWWEKIQGGHSHFLTGAGGYIQNYLYGFAGIRFQDQSLTVSPWPIPECSGFRIIGVDYRGSSFDVAYDSSQLQLDLYDLSLPNSTTSFCVETSGGDRISWQRATGLTLTLADCPVRIQPLPC